MPIFSSSRLIGQVVCAHKLVFHPKTHPCSHNRCSTQLLKISSTRHLTYSSTDKLKRAGKGYVKPLILDPFEVRIYLLRTSHSSHISITHHDFNLPPLLGLYTISQISPSISMASGNLHASPAIHPFVHSAVSLIVPPQFLSICRSHPARTCPAPGRIPQVPQCRSHHPSPDHPGPPATRYRTRITHQNGKGKKSIVVCVPVIDACIGLPFPGLSLMSTAATDCAVDILRCDSAKVHVAASTGGAKGMDDIEVVSLKVGTPDESSLAISTLQLLIQRHTAP